MTPVCSSEGKESLDWFALRVCHILTREWELVLTIASPCLALFLALTSSPVHPLTVSAPGGFVFFPRTSQKYLFLILNEQYGRFNSYL